MLNTCTVTNMSDRKSRQIIRRVKQINPNSILAVTGCYAQVAAKELEKIEEIDLIIGNTEKKDIVEIIENYTEKINLTDINNQKEFVDFGTTTYTEKTRAVIKVQDGCNNFCSYCIIPYAKGRVRSRKLENVIEEIQSVVKKGIQEVVITGIHVASYGLDFEDKNIRLIDLLEEINKIEGIERIRLGSLEPRIITKEFVERLIKLEKICNHFHLSLQSGCNETLERMNRKYIIEDFKNIVKILRENIPDVALTTDVIVGFPGETDEEFKKTEEFLKEIKFSKMHIFKYSKRKGTPAASFLNQVSDGKKEERSNILLEMSAKNEKEFAEKYIGSEIEVLFENAKEGHTKNYIKVIRKDNNEGVEIKRVIPVIWKEEALYL